MLGLDLRPKPTKVKVKAGLSQVKRGKREAYKIEKTITGWNIFAAALVKFLVLHCKCHNYLLYLSDCI